MTKCDHATNLQPLKLMQHMQTWIPALGISIFQINKTKFISENTMASSVRRPRYACLSKFNISQAIQSWQFPQNCK